LEYRQVVPVSAAFVMTLALADAWLLGALRRPAPAPPDTPIQGEPDGHRPVRSWIVVSQGAVLLAVLATCSLSWRGLTAQLESAMGPGAATCTSVESLDWARNTPLDQWAVTSTSLIVQGRGPTRIVAPSCSVDFSPGLAIISSHGTYTPYDRTWFDLSGLAVLKPEPAAYFEVKIVSPYKAGEAHSVTVRVRDAEGGMATGYRGTIHFTSSDPAAVLPPDYTFTLKDAGLHYFMYQAVLWTPGTQWLAATDTSDPAITGRQDGIEVEQPPQAT
jgi:hypothetical protein